ncbi:hypothetical protein ACFQ6N_39205 [Kitasatospora sp. NPDC056446]|uniref:hypothetical protein n=1 Tax=Kitasatospora sp. NPDC056446 TaxID=3345819 RepID=UPI0036827401
MNATDKKQDLERILWEAPIGAALLAWFLFAVRDDAFAGWIVYGLGWAGPATALTRNAVARTPLWNGGIVPVLLGIVSGILFRIFYA